MANDLVVRLNGDSKGFEQSINSAKQSLQGLQQEGTKLDQFQQRFDKVVNSSKPMKKQLADLRGMLAEMNKEGLNTTSVFTEIAEHAGSLADNIGDAQAAVRAFADDNFNLQASAQAFQAVASGASLVTGAMAMMGVESERTTEIIAKVQGAIALLNGVQSIANLLNKDSALMLKLKQIQMRINTAQTQKATTAEIANNVAKATGNAQTTGGTVATTANTVAKVANTTATTAATTAQNAWNTVTAISRAICGDFTGLIVLAAAGLSTYAIATAGSTDKVNEQTEAVKKQTSEVDKQKEAYKTYSESLKTTMVNMVNSFDKLKKEWESLSTVSQKTEFLKHYRSELDNLTDGINTVVKAEKYFQQNTNDFIKANLDRVKAIAFTAMVEKMKEKMVEEISHAMDIANLPLMSQTLPNGTKPTWSSGMKQGEDYTARDNGNGTFTYSPTPSGQAKYSANVMQGAVDRIVGDFNKSMQRIANSVGVNVTQAYNNMFNSHSTPTSHSSSSHSSSTTNEQKKYNENSLKYAQEQLRKYEELNAEANQKDEETLNKIQTQLKYWSDEVKKRQEIAKRWEEVNGYLAQLENERKELIDERNLLNPDQTDLIENYNKQIQELDKQIQDTKIKLGIEVELAEGTIPYLQNELKKVQEEIDKITLTTPKEEIDELIRKEEELKNQIKEIKELTDRTTHYTIEPEEEPEKIEKGSKWDKRHSLSNAQNRISQLQEDVELKIIGADEAMTIIDVINEKLKEIGLEPIEIKVENGQLLTAEQSAEKLVGFANNASSAIQSLGQAMQNLDEGGELAKAGLIASAIGQLVATFAGSFKGTWTIWEWIAGAAAGIATLTSVVSQISKFENGGIVGGNYTQSDRILVRANAGEMILNKHQQSNLYNAIANNNLGGGVNETVKFKIQGQELVGVLNNYNRKMGKLS